MKVQAPASIDVMMLLHCALYLPELVIWGYLLYNCSRQAIKQPLLFCYINIYYEGILVFL